MESARPQRTSPLHERLASAGAVFGTRMGVGATERLRARCRLRDGQADLARVLRGGAGRHPTDVAVFDQTSFSSTSSPDPRRSRVCSGCARPTSTSPSGDASTRRSSTPRDLRGRPDGHPHRRRLVPARLLLGDHGPRPRLARAARVPAEDVTEDYAVLGVMGPRSRALLSALRRMTGPTRASRSRPAARSTWRACVRATRMTYVGELGWELLVPGRRGGRRVRRRPGRGARDAGYWTIRSHRGWRRASGLRARADARPGPVEAGLVFATALSGTRTSSAGRRWRPTGRHSRSAAPGVAWSRSSSRHPSRCSGVGAAAARRDTGWTGHQRRLGCHGRRRRRARLPPARRSGHAGLAGLGSLRGRRRRGALRSDAPWKAHWSRQGFDGSPVGEPPVGTKAAPARPDQSCTDVTVSDRALSRSPPPSSRPAPQSPSSADRDGHEPRRQAAPSVSTPRDRPDG